MQEEGTTWDERSGTLTFHSFRPPLSPGYSLTVQSPCPWALQLPNVPSFPVRAQECAIATAAQASLSPGQSSLTAHAALALRHLLAPRQPKRFGFLHLLH